MNFLFRTLLRAAGTAGVGMAVLAMVVFANGYEYNVDSMELVKKGVVYFEGIDAPEGTVSVSVDGSLMEDFSAPGEIRVSPGKHHVQIAAEDAQTWEKEVDVSEDQVLRFHAIKLQPVARPGAKRFWSEEVLESIAGFSDVRMAGDRAVLTNNNLGFQKIYPAGERRIFFVEEFSGSVGSAEPPEYEEEEESRIAPAHADGEPVIAASRIGKTYHVLVITESRRLLLCDGDGENCRSFGTADPPHFSVSEDSERFLVVQNGELKAFDFAEPSVLARIFAAMGGDADLRIW